MCRPGRDQVSVSCRPCVTVPTLLERGLLVFHKWRQRENHRGGQSGAVSCRKEGAPYTLSNTTSAKENFSEVPCPNPAAETLHKKSETFLGCKLRV